MSVLRSTRLLALRLRSCTRVIGRHEHWQASS